QRWEIGRQIRTMRGGKWMVPFAVLVVSGQPAYAQPSEQTNTTASGATQTPAPPWPRTIHSGGAPRTLYEPQPVKWAPKQCTAAWAVAVRRDAGENAATPLYGVVHLEAVTDVDSAQGLVSLHDVRITSADFPTDSSHADTYRRAIESTGQL